MEDILEELKTDYACNGLKKNKVAIKVMVVDDALFIRRSLGKVLTTVGYDIIAEAEDGKEAVEKYFEVMPELTTMDITMPIMEGTEAVEEIIKKDPEAKIVIVSAMGYQNIVKQAILNGAKNFIVKPIKPDNVKRLLTILKSAFTR